MTDTGLSNSRRLPSGSVMLIIGRRGLGVGDSGFGRARAGADPVVGSRPQKKRPAGAFRWPRGRFQQGAVVVLMSHARPAFPRAKIGRASCRERVCQYV